MAKVIAKVYGTALAPGVSRNGRLYTPELIERAVARAQDRLRAGGMVVRERDDMTGHPMAQRTHHAAEDDSTAIVGRVARLWLEDGKALFEAHIADTPPGRIIADLVDTTDGQPPFLRGVSIRGAWMGESYTVAHRGQMVETADDLDLDGLDYTHKPGVPGAGIDRVERVGRTRARETTSDGRAVIYESVQEVRVFDAVEESTDPAPTGVFADHGYLGEPRLPVGTLVEAVESWDELGETGGDVYTANQLKRVRQRVVRGLREHGVDVTPEGFLLELGDGIDEAIEDGDVEEGRKRVRTAAGAKMYGKPIGSPIGGLSSAVKSIGAGRRRRKAAKARARSGEKAANGRPKYDKKGREITYVGGRPPAPGEKAHPSTQGLSDRAAKAGVIHPRDKVGPDQDDIDGLSRSSKDSGNDAFHWYDDGNGQFITDEYAPGEDPDMPSTHSAKGTPHLKFEGGTGKATIVNGRTPSAGTGTKGGVEDPDIAQAASVGPRAAKAGVVDKSGNGPSKDDLQLAAKTASESETPVYLSFNGKSFTQSSTKPSGPHVKFAAGSAKPTVGGAKATESVEEDYPMALPARDGDGSVSVCLSARGLSVNVSGYDLDAGDLQTLGRRAMAAAAAALDELQARGAALPYESGNDEDDELDEDDAEDGDAVESGKRGNLAPPFQKKGTKAPADDDAEGDDDDEDDDEDDDKGRKPWESTSDAVTGSGAAPTHQEDPAVSETQKPAAETAAPVQESAAGAPAVTLSAEQFAALLDAAKGGAPAAAPAVAEAPVESAAAPAEVVESTEDKVARLVAEKLVAAGLGEAKVEETEEQKVARLVEEGVTAGIAAHVERNGAVRKGRVVESGSGAQRLGLGGTITQATGVGNSVGDLKLHEMSHEEFDAVGGVALERHVMGVRSVWNQPA